MGHNVDICLSGRGRSLLGAKVPSEITEAKLEAQAEERSTVEQAAHEERAALHSLQRTAQHPCLGISFATLTLRMNLTARSHCALANATWRNRRPRLPLLR